MSSLLIRIIAFSLSIKHFYASVYVTVYKFHLIFSSNAKIKLFKNLLCINIWLYKHLLLKTFKKRARDGFVSEFVCGRKKHFRLKSKPQSTVNSFNIGREVFR